MAKSIRFTANFFIDIVNTILNEQGEMVVDRHSLPVEFGQIYQVESYEDDGTFLRITFPKDSRLAGIAPRVTKAYVDINDIVQEKKAHEAAVASGAKPAGGCGGCGRKNN